MRIALWIVQALLAVAFGMAGFMKLFTPVGELAEMMVWVAHTPVWLVKFIAVAEIAGAIGLVVPALTRIKPFLTPLAAVGLLAIMALAVPMHLYLGEGIMFPNLVLGALAGFVAWGRFVAAPFEPR